MYLGFKIATSEVWFMFRWLSIFDLILLVFSKIISWCVCIECQTKIKRKLWFISFNSCSHTRNYFAYSHNASRLFKGILWSNRNLFAILFFFNVESKSRSTWDRHSILSRCTHWKLYDSRRITKWCSRWFSAKFSGERFRITTNCYWKSFEISSSKNLHYKHSYR